MHLSISYGNFIPTVMVQEFESLIWTERYNAHGDFELVVKENRALVSNLLNRPYLHLAGSNKIMMIETIETPAPEEGEKSIVKYKGRSLEAFLEERTNTTFGDTDTVVRTGRIGEIMLYLVDRYCISIDQNNALPDLHLGFHPNKGPVETLSIKRGNMYSVVKSLADSAGYGFMIYKESPGLLRFSVYDGVDKSDPSLETYREYSEDNETLTKVSSVESIANYKNHARVQGARQIHNVYAPGVSSNISGYAKRTLVVDADDIGKDSDAPLSQDIPLLTRRGLEALAESDHRYHVLIDGEMHPDNWYDSDFRLGDIVMVKDKYGRREPMRVSERIRSVDASGDRLIPTFSIL